MRAVALALSLALASPSLAEDPNTALEATRGVVILPGEEAVPVGRGCWLPEKKCVETAQKLKAAETGPGVTLLVVVAVVSAAVGFGIAKVVK